MGEAVREIGSPLGHQSIRFSLMHFIRANLIAKCHQQIAVYESTVGLQQHKWSYLEPWVLLHSLEIKTDYRNLGKIALLKCLPKEKNIITCPATTTGLGDYQGDLVAVIPPMLDGVDKLPDNELSGIADVIVHIAQSFADYVRTLVVKKYHVIPMV
jgi:hypothetical protein